MKQSNGCPPPKQRQLGRPVADVNMHTELTSKDTDDGRVSQYTLCSIYI